ncbi:MAG TPA: glycosyltransferase family 2 protein [Stellaceae bacterium]|jgi:glycosyltransferase involved in cell wall biosynthesis|nr:glycosyltransferase family 2 protein [Stellaceae bacterium]
MAASGVTTISVVIPLYNRREEIERALASVLRQSRAPDEILVVDDASRDGSADTVAALAESRINLLRHERNQGASAARNTGIAAARGDWIALLDSDDEWDARKLELQLDALTRATGEAVASVTGYVIRDYRTGEERAFVPRPADAARDALVWGCPLGIGSTLLARRSIFAAIGPFDPALPRLEDWEWLMRYLPAHRLDVMPQALTIVHKKSDPSRAQVAAAVGRIRALHRRDWYRHSWLAGRKFDSTLLIEEAATAHYEGDDRRAAALALRALGAYPFRPGLLALLARRVLRRR